MNSATQEIAVIDLKEGMHVVELDRPWHETPFPIQGFYIRSDDEIAALKFYCKTVHIETAEARVEEAPYQGSSSKQPSSQDDDDGRAKRIKVPEIVIKKRYEYPVTVPVEKELKEAVGLVEDVSNSLSGIIQDVRDGHELDVQGVGRCADAMTQSVIRNPDALLFLSRIKNRDAHTYSHSLKTAIWALIIARDYGLGPESVKNIGKSALLSKIGRVAIMDKLKDSQYRTPQSDAQAYREYPTVGAQMLKNGNFPKIVVETVQNHREFHNGSGFPNGLTGEKIPLTAKIVGIADYYEFLVEHRTGHSGMSPSRAAAHLFGARDVLFQADLVDRLIATIGVYPVGSNVILSDGRTGVITELNPEHRLSPTLQIIMDANGIPVEQGIKINLATWNETAETPITIKRCLPFHSVPCPVDIDNLPETTPPKPYVGLKDRIIGWFGQLAAR